MSAKEMFKNLGFKQFIGTSTKWKDYIEYQNEDKYIWFYPDSKTIEIKFDFDVKTLQAINKQIEELGWNDDRS